MKRGPLSDVDRLVLQAILSSPDKPLHGLTKLQKVLFIAAHPKDFGLSIARPIHSLEFKVYKHGPFCEEVYRSLARLEQGGLVRITQSRLERATGEMDDPNFEDEQAETRTMYAYEPIAGAEDEIVGADEVDLRLVKEASKKWGWLTPGQIEDFVNRRVGLTPDLKARFLNTAWEDFVRFAGAELKRRLPEPTESFWRSEQAFNRERRGLILKGGENQFVAYCDGARVGTGPDDVSLFDEVSRRLGAPPDFIGYLNESGLRRVMAPAAG